MNDETTAARPCPLEGADIWVLAGQSNMQGSARHLDPLPPLEDVMVYGLDDAWRPADPPLHRIHEATAPVHRRTMRERAMLSDAEIDRMRELSRRAPKAASGLGPGYFFARLMVEATGRPVGLVACAHGGASMDNWSPAEKHRGDDSLYGAMLGRLRAIGSPEVRGVLWYQGESDTMPQPWETENEIERSTEYSLAYERKTLDFIDALRADLGQPDLPFYVAQLGGFHTSRAWLAPAWSRVRESQRRLGELRANVFVVAAIDLTLDDPIHIDTASVERLGVRLARLALGRERESAVGATPIELDRIETLKPVHANHCRFRVVFKGVNGRLRSAGPPAGFTLLPRDPALEGPLPSVFRVELDEAMPNSAIVHASSFDKGTFVPADLYYGAGLAPCANLVDEKDIAVPAFGPVPVEIDVRPWRPGVEADS